MASFSYLGHIGIDDAFPILAAAKVQVRGLAAAMLPDVASRLAGALRASVSISTPGVVGDITAKIQALTSLIASLPTLSLVPPTGAISIVGTLILQLGAIKALLDAALSWGDFPGSVHVFLYEGKASDMSAAIAAHVASGFLGTIPAANRVVAPVIVVDANDRIATASLRAMLRVP